METPSAGRPRQRQRTRIALLDAAAELIALGLTPTVAEVAERADISRATAYRYFPSQDLLLTEAMLHGAVPDITGTLAQPDVHDDAERRLDALVHLVSEWVTQRESGFRAYLRHTLEPVAPEVTGEDTVKERRRGGRRIAWIDETLAPVHDQIPPDRYRRLAAALSLFLGIETQIVLKDIWDMDDAEADDVARWAATALLRQALQPDDPPATTPPI